MSEDKSRPPAPDAESRQRRMAEALRANLRRRKEQSREQARERTAGPVAPDKGREG